MERFVTDISKYEIVNEETDNDIIFNKYVNGNNNFVLTGKPNVDRLIDTADYKEPDYRKYIFQNVYPNTHSYFEVHPNGLYNNIRYKNIYGNTGNIFGSKATNETGWGIYIIEYFKVRVGGTVTKNIVRELYLDNPNINMDEDMRIMLADKLNMNNHAISSDKRVSADFYIRVITYIPENNFNTSSAIYDKTTNTYLIKGIPSVHNIHPMNEYSKEDMIALRDEGDYEIIVDVVDNDAISGDYYINIGKDIVKIEPRKSRTEANKAKLSILRRGARILEKTTTKEDMNDIGIYKSIDECKYNGDINNKLKEQELENKAKELEAKSKELDMKKSELEVKSKALEVKEKELEVKEKQAETTLIVEDIKRETAKLSIDNVKVKHELDMTNIKVKHDLDMTNMRVKHELDVKTKIIDTKIKITTATLNNTTEVIKTNAKIKAMEASNRITMKDILAGALLTGKILK